jgi:hypothetical protein
MILSHACLPIPTHPHALGGRNYTVIFQFMGLLSENPAILIAVQKSKNDKNGT